MKKLLLLLLAGALVPVAAHAQAAPTPAPATAAAPAPTPPVPESKQEAILPTGVVNPAAAATTPAPGAPATALVKRAPMTPAANPNAIKVKAEANPATGRLTVKTDNSGPTRVELTDAGGRPVLTYTMMNGQNPAVLNVSRLPAGSYIVRCTAYEKTGMRQVMIGR
ncbi:T9SS type A sorting domain-containing protein [Hymenobacter sp.]|uniref:T9SS type A sorting domain-containing protein n=1 Tax=Hymenobacter sp. TaxID=1898978 RepID=UPI00286CD998|nr:T9SS type A sorting domain-containing protein [Hymenobacter sp.]